MTEEEAKERLENSPLKKFQESLKTIKISNITISNRDEYFKNNSDKIKDLIN